MNLISKLREFLDSQRNFDKANHKIRISLGRIELAQLAQKNSADLSSYEMGVYSQWGEDGILQHLIRNTKITQKSFVEFGVESYREANTRFLLVNDNWHGLIIDGSEANIRSVQKEDIYWRHSLTAVQAFITRDNINDLISTNGFAGDLGILSIDIDGNDYWVWETITVAKPSIVVIEYNHRFGPSAAVTVPYKHDFVREKEHYSCIYYGASLKALELLGKRKGYALVGCNSAGNNAFFIRKDLLQSPLVEKSAEEAFVAGKFREARGPNRKLLFLTSEEERKLLKSLPLVEIT